VPDPLNPTEHPTLVELGGRLRELAGDNAYQAGRVYLRKGLVKQATVAGTTAYASVSGSTDYRVSVAFAGEPRVTCSCPAHRRSKYCKHVVAVCSALLELPSQFTPVEAVPEPPKAVRRPRKAATAGSREAEKVASRAAGLETVDRLLAELTDGGLMSLGPDKAALLAGAGELVRALKLRRLGNSVLALQRAAGAPPNGGRPAAGRAARAGAATARIAAAGFAELLMDAYVTRRTTGAHLEGRIALDPRLAEDLLGKTWREEELEAVGGLELLEVAATRGDDGEFRIETSYLVDLLTGEVYAERLIAPLRLSGPPKPRHRLRLLVDEAGLYPGVAPRRIKLRRARRAPLAAEQVRRLLEVVPSDAAELRRRLLERLEVPFGPHEVAVLFRPAALLQCDERVGAVDQAGRFLALAWPERWAEQLLPLLPPPGSYALFGLLRQAERGLELQCLSAIGELGWRQGPIYPDVD
jgi:hypothetical protein